MNRAMGRIATAALFGVLVLTAGKVARASAVLLQPPRAGEETGRVQRRGHPVRVAPAGSLTEIAQAEHALVFVYSPDCTVCHANMARWVELVAELNGGPPALYAVAPMDTPAARAYWGGLVRYVRVVTATPAEVRTAFGVESTPATLLVQNGYVRGMAVGSLTAAARAQVRAFARGEPW